MAGSGEQLLLLDVELLLRQGAVVQQALELSELLDVQPGTLRGRGRGCGWGRRRLRRFVLLLLGLGCLVLTVLVERVGAARHCGDASAPHPSVSSSEHADSFVSRSRLGRAGLTS